MDVPREPPPGTEGEDRQPLVRHPQGRRARWTGGTVSLLQEGVPVSGHQRGRKYLQLPHHQLDMLLCTLTSEETFKWGRCSKKTLEDLPDLFYDFCWQRAAELKAQIKSLEGIEEEPRVTALPSGYPRWLGPCVLGEICGGHHMPEVCQMFEARNLC